MAGIVTHLVYAQQSGEDAGDFLVGNILADINYITSEIERARLHISPDELESFKDVVGRFYNQVSDEVKEELVEGLVFHAGVDVVWSEGVWVESDSDYFGLALKLWLDEMWWDKLTDRKRVIGAMEKYKGKQVLKGVSIESHNRWYEMVQRYLKSRGGEGARLSLIEDLGFSSQVGDEVGKLIETRLRGEDKVLGILERNLKKHEFMKLW